MIVMGVFAKMARHCLHRTVHTHPACVPIIRDTLKILGFKNKKIQDTWLDLGINTGSVPGYIRDWPNPEPTLTCALKLDKRYVRLLKHMRMGTCDEQAQHSRNSLRVPIITHYKYLFSKTKK
jgi:hypothetical protein